jgi:hypothetical protein
MSLFNTYEAEVLDHINGVTTLTPEAHLHLALSTTTPAEDATNITPPSGNNYAKVQVTNSSATWDAASGGAADNGAVITWPKASGSWGTVTYVVAYKADDTTPIWFAAIDSGTGVAIGANDQLSIPAGDFDWTCD